MLAIILIPGAGGGSRTHMTVKSTDFESVASAIPPLRPERGLTIRT